MSSFDKIVKLACKPKNAPPKAKYIDPIIAATWSDDGAVSDVCKALVPRIREPNHIIVFKALLVLHTMIRNGSTDNVLSFLSQADILKLKNVSAVNWEGYAAPETIQHYAKYLDSRIRAYRDLKHDAIRVQSDTNRDIRNSVSINEDLEKSRKQRNNDKPSLPTRSKTLAGRKLRSMTVEKGLLRETKIVHNMIDALVECRFYLDNLEDELNITALRMLVKDLLILFQAGNEGVINVLEHYFEMSHVDASEALQIYRHFCTQTELVVEFLGVAKKLENLLNVPIPNLKHAPVSLAGALQEYLDDSNFESNRLEYKANKATADKPPTTRGKTTSKSSTVTFKETSAPTQTTGAGSSTTNGASNPPVSKDVSDFFNSIEAEQQPMFGVSPTSPSQQPFPQGTVNPFSQMLTGQPTFNTAIPVINQPTGFLISQHTATPANPFNAFLTTQQTQQPPRPFSAFIPQQQTGFLPQPQGPFATPQQIGFLQPQATGGNPFRQSMLVPQTTGMALFANTQPGAAGQAAPGASMGQTLFVNNNPTSPSSAPNSATPFASAFGQGQTSNTSFNPNFGPASNAIAPSVSAFGPVRNAGPIDVPNRPASTPLTSINSFPAAQPVKTHMTGTKNPFGPVLADAPPVPKVPTLMELARGAQGNGMTNQQQQQQAQQQQQQQVQPQRTGFNWAGSALSPGSSDISSIASSFTNVAKSSAAGSPNPSGFQSTSPTASAFSGTSAFSNSSSSQPTGATNTGLSSSTSPLTSQITGFAGLKPFKPSSSFGAALLESMPGAASQSPPAENHSQRSTPSFASNLSAPQISSNPNSSNTSSQLSTPNFTLSSFNTTGTSFPSSPLSFGSTNPSSTGALNSQPTGLGSALTGQPTGLSGGFKPTSAFGASMMSGATTGSSLGTGLRPQITGGANPFRASMVGSGSPSFGSSPTPPVPGLPSTATGHPFGQNTFNGMSSQPFSSAFTPTNQQQNHPPASLI
ncbi:ANTH-domain-containing protein [Coprinopsis marcescibilis]|uniref:ANTH-domain-containing protein n=1 Tax=Coprinopsis marcescibilis TaxID=230819 RepID=A0A5C3L0I6_COPMA|nr:ANTH-domain-containing protein [Coprinopsis marcescibilis]